jgi:4,5-dihydroxyphthalate decarboxylase
MDIQLSIGMASNPRTWPIFDGTVKPDGIDLIPTPVHASELFWRQLKFGDFDVSEMSFSSLIMAMANGDDRWVGLPVFTTRRFFHTGILVRKDSGINSPADLKGKNVGVPEYQQTAALWTRGVLQNEFGVEPKDMTFYMERVPEQSHGGATGFKPPAGVTVNQIPLEKSIGSMMLSGELDATLLYLVDPNLIDRSTADLWHHPDIKPLFADPYEEGLRFYKKTGLYPINHGMIMKREIVEKHPWAILNVYKAFKQANDIATQRRMTQLDEYLETGTITKEQRASVAAPLIQHGVVANRFVLETAAQYSFEQGLTPKLAKLEDVFHKATLEQ